MVSGAHSTVIRALTAWVIEHPDDEVLGEKIVANLGTGRLLVVARDPVPREFDHMVDGGSGDILVVSALIAVVRDASSPSRERSEADEMLRLFQTGAACLRWRGVAFA